MYNVVYRKNSEVRAIVCEREIVIRLNLKTNGAKRQENYFLGGKQTSSFSTYHT